MSKGQKLYQRSGKNIYFKHEDMDFFLQWMLGYSTYGGLSTGEVFSITSRIKNGQASSWQKEFYEYGSYQEKCANELLENHNSIAAGKRYLCAFTAYRAAALYTSPKAKVFPEIVGYFENAFQKSIKLLSIGLEVIDIPFENGSLPGYFYKSKNRSAPLIIIIGGSDSFREDLYFIGGAAGIERGYNVLLIDLPGQGKVPGKGLYFRYDTEKPMMVSIDWLVSKGYISDNKIGCYGISGGGYFGMRAVVYDKRIKAFAASTPIYDVPSVYKAEVPQSLLWLLNHKRLLSIIDNSMVVTIEKAFWQAGVKTYQEALEKINRMVLDFNLIDCPVFAICGDGESDELKKQTKLFYEKVKSKSSKSQYRYYTSYEGAEAHCQLNNLKLAHQELYDWFDVVFRE